MRLSNLLASCCMATAVVALGGSTASAQSTYYGGPVAPVAYWGGDVMAPSCGAGPACCEDPSCCEDPGCCADPNSCTGGGGCGACNWNLFGGLFGGHCGSGCGACGGSGCNACGHGRGGCGNGNPDCEAWELMERSCNGWKVGGWIQAGIYANASNSVGPGGNGPVPFNQTAGQFNLHQGWIYLDRELNTDDGFGWGMHADYLYGIDAADTAAFGDASWDYTWQSSAYGYGSAIPQAYAQVGYGDLNVKAGKFFTIMGYEVVQATGNFFYSHAYTMNYGEPFTHTGALAEWKPADDLTLWGGYTFGWDSGYNNYLDASTFLGGVSYSGLERVTATYTTNFGYFGDGTGSNLGGTTFLSNSGDIWLQSAVIMVDVTDRLQYVVQSDYGTNSGGIETTNGTPYAGSNSWYGVNNYLFYTINDCYKVGARYEWFYDDGDAARSRVGNGEVEYQSISLGLNWTPHTNVIIRPEARFDWNELHGGNQAYPSNGVADSRGGIFCYGFDAIFTY